MLDSKPLGGDSRHIFHQTDLGIRFTGGLNADIAYFSVGQRNVVDQIPRIALAAPTNAFKLCHDLLETFFCQVLFLFLRNPQHTEKILCHIDRGRILPDLIAAQIHTRHLHDPQKLCGSIEHIMA